MRRIYESEALRRSDEEPHAPRERPDDDGPRTIDYASASHALMPTALRHRAVSVSVETDRESYGPDEPVRFRVLMHNRFPVPVVLRVPTPVRWQWGVDGHPEASRVEATPPAEPALFEFDRGERKRFDRRWHQRFRESEREWSRAARGEHTLSAWVAVDDPAAKGLHAEATVRIE